MLKDYMTIREASEKWGVTARRVQVLCADGRVKDAVRFGREWAIPIDAEKPEDKRVTSGKYRNWRNREKNTDSEKETYDD